MNKKNVKRGFAPYLFLIVFVCIVYLIFSSMNQKVNELSKFLSDNSFTAAIT